MTFSINDITTLNKIHRLNLINSITGFKSANLIVSQSKNKIDNVAIFSSVTHLGSNPALLGFVTRPITVKRDTYNNLKANPFFTINAITSSMIVDAHLTSAPYDEKISEFDKTNLVKEYHDAISIPFIKGSPVQLYCKVVNEYPIHENTTVFLVASIEKIYVQDELLHDDYWVQLDKGSVVSINGLDGYVSTNILDRFSYARPDSSIKSLVKNDTQEIKSTTENM